MKWVDACIALQQQALKDGYIISLDIDISNGHWGLSLTVIAGDSFYYINPDDLTVNYIDTIH